MPGATTFDSAKVFSATTAGDRENLGGRVTRWMREHPGAQIVDYVVTQSSDEAYHCLTITLFYRAGQTAEQSFE